MNTNHLDSSARFPAGFGSGGTLNAQPNPNAASAQFQSNGAASQMVPLILQMQPSGNLSFFPLQAQAQGFQQSPQWLGMQAQQPSTMSQMAGTPGFASPAHAMAAMNDLMTLAAGMQQVPAEVPVGSLADDEEILVKALRKGRARGLNSEQVLRGLHNVNRHTEAAWKNYFLANLDRLYPKMHARRDGHPTSGTGPKLQPLYLTKDSALDSMNSPRSGHTKPIKHEKPPSTSYGHHKSSSRQDSGPRSEQASDRHKPGSSSQDRHAHSSKAKHATPSSPKAIGIKRPRIKRRRIVRSPTPTPTPEPSEAPSSPEPTEPEDRAYRASDASDPDAESDSYGRAHTQGRLKPMQVQRVTEEDFRAMARYMYENPRKWGESPTGIGYWRGFASREENASRRSLDAWARASRTYQEKIVLYVEEYAGQVEQEDGSDVDESTVPTQDQESEKGTPTQDVPPHVPIEAVVEETVTVPRKRSSSPSRTAEQEGPDEKRMRQETSDNGLAEVSVTEPGIAGSSESGPSGEAIPIPQEPQPQATSSDATPAVPLDAEKA